MNCRPPASYEMMPAPIGPPVLNRTAPSRSRHRTPRDRRSAPGQNQVAGGRRDGADDRARRSILPFHGAAHRIDGGNPPCEVLSFTVRPPMKICPGT
jgi:hypothetical protein